MAQAHNDYSLNFVVMEGVPGGRNGVTTWSRHRHFQKEEEARRHAETMNEREDRLRELAFKWLGWAARATGSEGFCYEQSPDDSGPCEALRGIR